MKFVDSIWRSAKIERRISIGPLSLWYRFRHKVPVTQSLRSWSYPLWANQGFVEIGALTGAPPRGSVEFTKVNKQLTEERETALLVGVGPGFGYELARKLARSGMSVGVVSRNAEHLRPLVDELNKPSALKVFAYGCDATDEISVKKTFSRVVNDIGVPNLVVYSVQGFSPGRTIDVEVPAFEDSWRQNCLGGFLVGREAARFLEPLGRGTIVFVGSSSAMIGRAGHLNLAVGKFGLRAIAQVMSRELWSSGIHVLHLVIDADIQESESPDTSIPQSDPAHIADLLHTLHSQPKSAWTSEIDVRPWNDSFWQHC